MCPARSASTIDKNNPAAGDPIYLAVGKLRRSHGVHGEIIMDVVTDFPERLKPGITLYIGEQHRELRLLSLRWQHQSLLLGFDEYRTPEAVGELRNQWVFVRADDRPPLEEGEYYHHQLLGIRVLDEDGQLLGNLSEILETGANNVYVISSEQGPDILLPAIDSVILDINLEQGEMRVHVLEGLLPD